MTAVQTVVLLSTKPSSDNDSGVRHCFRAETSLPLTQSALAVPHDRLCCPSVGMYVHADAVRALF